MRNCFLTICNNLSQEMHANFKHRKCYDNNIYWHASRFHCIFVEPSLTFHGPVDRKEVITYNY